MSATKLWDAGYRDLVSVVPPGAPISERSRIDPTQRGKVPGRRGGNGWYGYHFADPDNLPSDRDEVHLWETWGANVGILGDHFPAIDVDSEDPRLTEAVKRIAAQSLGPAPVRLSRDPRALLVYRAREPFPRRAIKVRFAGEEHTIEVLGRGRQYLVHGQHPSGTEYRWAAKPLWDVKPESLTEITARDVDTFLDELAESFTLKGLEVERVGTTPTDHDPPEDQKSLLAPSDEDLETVVGLIPNDEKFADRDAYITMGHAIKAASGGSRPDLFLDWAERWENGENDPETVTADWSRMHAPFRVGWGWLEDLAREHGYMSARDEFDADTDAEPPRQIPQMSIPGVLDFSDEWMAHMIYADVKDKIRYVPGTGDSGTWLLWNGHKWVTDQTLGHERLEREHLSRLAMHLRDLASNATKKEAAPLTAAAKACQSSRGINAVSRLLRAKVACTDGDFDLDKYVLNTPDGPLDLKTGKPCEGDGMYRRATKVVPQHGSRPLWDGFMQFLSGGDPEYIDYIQRVLGYTLTGDMSAKSLWFIWGSESDTGKSTFIRVVQEILGDYAASVDVSNFLASDSSALRPALAQLAGVRLVTATEPAAGRSWDEEKVKAITGGDVIQTRLLYGQPFTYDPQFKILVVGNHEPSIKKMDDAMRRRIHIMPFTRKVPAEQQIPNLSQRIVQEEGKAVLAWMLEGCRMWLEEGLEMPALVRDRTELYAEGEDLMYEWVRDCCEPGEDHEATRQDLYSNWADWARARGEQPGTLRAFRSEFEGTLLAHGIAVEPGRVDPEQTGTRARGYRGIRLRPRVKIGTEEFNV